MLRRIILMAALILQLPFQVNSASAASTDRNTLYGLTDGGAVYLINTSTAAVTLVRQLPTSASGYGDLAIYKGTFITLNVHGLVAFGPTSLDEVTIPYSPAGQDSPSSLGEYFGNGLARGWGSNEFTDHEEWFLRQIDPSVGTFSNVSSSTIVPTVYLSSGDVCFPGSINYVSEGPTAGTFYGSSRAYAMHECQHSPAGSTFVLLRADLVSGTWSKTLDAPISIPNDASALAADPGTDGILYVSEYSQPSTSTTIGKLVISGSTFTYTTVGTISGKNGFIALAFGPPAADIVEPTSITEIKQAQLRGWEPIQAEFEASN
jgi:hypothetical protein